MFAYAMKNGPRALSVKQFGKYSGKELYEALMKNQDGLIKMLNMESKAAEKFLKTFASMDAMEYYLLLRTSKPWAKAFSKMDFKMFKEGMGELNSIVFANKTYFKSFFQSFKYNFSKPMKILLANLLVMPGIVVADCFEVEFRFIKKVNGKRRLIKQVGDLLGPLYKTTEDNIKWVTFTLEPGQAADTTCMLLDMLLSNMTGTPDQATNEYMEMLLNQDGIEIDEKEITITIKTTDGEEKEIDLLASGDESIISEHAEIADGLVRAQAEVLTQDEDIYATMIYHLGDGNLDSGAQILNEYILNGCRDPEYWDLIFWLVEQEIYISKRQELLQKISSKRIIYE